MTSKRWTSTKVTSCSTRPSPTTISAYTRFIRTRYCCAIACNNHEAITMNQLKLPNNSQQRGFVLVACLIILLVLTVLGVNNMSTSNLEERMAANSQTKLGTFQLAESAIANTIVTNSIFDTAIGDPSTAVHTTYTIGTQTVTTDTLVNPTQIGYSTTGSSLSKFTGVLMDITSTSTINGTAARTVLTQGVTRVLPKQ
ncbi:MAG: hypothetical protein GC149_05490 [Gammaproteobacteria bacterium]|nr:hypothetical protein [Gammaproteobacteria bacterium]